MSQEALAPSTAPAAAPDAPAPAPAAPPPEAAKAPAATDVVDEADAMRKAGEMLRAKPKAEGNTEPTDAPKEEPQAAPDGEAKADPEAPKTKRQRIHDTNQEWMRARKAREAGEKARDELDARQKQLDQEFADVRELQLLAKASPTKFFERIAQSHGLKPSEYFRQLATQLSGDAPQTDATGSDAVKEEIASLRKELAESRQREEQRQQQQHHSQVQANATAQLIDAVRSDDFKELYPTLNRMNPNVLAETIYDAVGQLLREDPDTPGSVVLELLERRESTYYSRYVQGNGSPASPEGKESKGHIGSPAPKALNAAGSTKSTRTIPTNTDRANGGVRRKLTDEEAMREAGRLLRGARGE